MCYDRCVIVFNGQNWMQFGKVIFMNTENYQLAICDDEVYWQKEILKYCKTIEKRKEIAFTYHIFSSGEELLEFKDHLDILLLDEEMKKISGQMIKEYFESVNRDTMIIFITSHNEIIYDSFGKNVYGFLEKPIVEKSFYELFERILTKLNKKQYITLPDSINGEIIIPCTDIMYMEADGSYTKIYLKNHDMMIVRRGMNEIEKANTFRNIIRVHKSYIVNFNYAEKLTADNTLLVLTNGIQIPIARRRKKQIHELFFKIVAERASNIWDY